MVTDKFSKRFAELAAKSEAMEFRDSDVGRRVPAGGWEAWVTSCQGLVKAVFGKDSPHYSNFTGVAERCTGYGDDIEHLRGVFRSAKEDFEGGDVFSVDLTISGEIFGSLVALAKRSLADSHKDVAAVLAAAALEDALKRYANVNGLDVDDKSMEEVVNALTTKGLVSGASGAQKTLLKTMPTLRNYAMHANWDKLSEPDVGSIIGFVEQFLLTRFGD